MFEDIKEAEDDKEQSNADRRGSWITDERKGSLVKLGSEETKSIDVDLDQIDIK